MSNNSSNSRFGEVPDLQNRANKATASAGVTIDENPYQWYLQEAEKILGREKFVVAFKDTIKEFGPMVEELVVEEVIKESKQLPAFEEWDDLEDVELPELKMILEGIFNEGAKMTVGGDSKAGKTWILMNVAFAIATGRDWLGIKTYQGRVLYVNCELQKQIFKKRGLSIKSAMGITGRVPNLATWTTRGHFLTAETFRQELLERVGDQKFDVIIVDPSTRC
jgi:RecA-family ATPase